MSRQALILLVVCVFATTPSVVEAANGNPADPGSSESSPAWPVAASFKATIGSWARRQGWPAPQFLTDADWPVDVPGSIPGSLEHALEILVQGFGSASLRPRIAISANHVIVVTAVGADQ